MVLSEDTLPPSGAEGVEGTLLWVLAVIERHLAK